MADSTRGAEMRRQMEVMKEQMRVESENTAKSIAEVKEMIAAVAAAVQQNLGRDRNDEGTSQGVHRGANMGDMGVESQSPRGQPNWQGNYPNPTRYSQVEFPKFKGEDLRGWVYRCEQFFEVDETPPESKGEYVRALNDRFGALLYEDPMSELVNLKQTGTIQEYLDKFDELVNCVELSEAYACNKRKQLYIMEIPEDELEEMGQESGEELRGEEIQESSDKTEENITNYHVSMNAMTGLVTLGNIQWNFKELKKVFEWKGQKVSLRGKQPPSITLVDNKEMNRSLQKPGQLAMMQVWYISKNDGDKSTLLELEGPIHIGNIPLDNLLQEFNDIFEKPTSLPPPRLYDHCITLKEDISAVNVKPYRETKRFPTFNSGEQFEINSSFAATTYDSRQRRFFEGYVKPRTSKIPVLFAW
ncbi:hypothetical protein BUALT_Bualt08G0043700 [Buddleja alternifolia]|uniref:Retrotransposon gag domain-containing protein n=1 Tax=Buddleja alternifolia TaxID=168488 RepID=A0AAV6XBL6_9LAMI|nr:hypothetical protein BUALT_Bualt08G0043700 [Buddleja alternifolia]